jgi:LemA protein
MPISPGSLGIIVAVLALVWLIATFNSLTSMRNRVQNAWSQIDVQLKRRHDLIPNLVETVRGYMQHEESVFQAITQARADAMSAGENIQGRTAAESRLSTAVSRLFVVAENYPQLRAVENFQTLEEELASTEDRIAYARQFYNDEVMRYNTAQTTFPRNLLSHVLGFSCATLFSADESDRSQVQVKV